MLTTPEQNSILMEVVLAAGHVDRHRCQHGNWASYPTVNSRLRDLREALRLDDIKLILISEQARATGRKLEWTSEVPALCSR